MVYCPHRDDGCAWSGQRQLLGGHLRECEHATELCPFTGCDVEMKREELAEHVNNCEYRVVACEKCEAPVAFKDLKVRLVLASRLPRELT